MSSQTKAPPPPPKPRKASIPSKYLMNDIHRGTSRVKLINSLLSPTHKQRTSEGPAHHPDMIFGLITANSRLDDELNVAKIDFPSTPLWLLDLNEDPCGFPKKTPLGTIWRGVDANARDERGQTEFIRAVIQGTPNLHYAEMLAEFDGTDVNIQDEQGRTALHWTCAEGLSEMVKLCLSVSECLIGLRDSEGLTAFDISLRGRNRSEVIPTLFYHSMFELQETHPQEALLRVLTVASDPVKGRAVFPGVAIFDPILDRNKALVQALVDRGIDLTVTNGDGDTALHVATRADDVETTSILLKAGSDIDARDKEGRTALQLAEEIQMAEIVVLLKSATETPEDSITLLERANEVMPALQPTEKDQQEDIVLQREVVADTEGIVPHRTAVGIELSDGKGQTPLIQAALKGDVTAVRRLLDSGAAIDAKAGNGDTALHKAVYSGHMEIVEILLAGGACVGAVCSGRYTPLHEAAKTGNTEIVKKLLAVGAEIEAKTNRGVTALHEAARCGNAKMVNILLEHGAQLEATEDNGMTALHKAVSGGYPEVVIILLEHKAELEARCNAGKPLKIALKYGHQETAKILIDAGAQTKVDRLGNAVLHTLRLK
ncbi:hypothetical protein Q9L58_006398 [Maublancomyces gigas]|uniref:Uncharacterized protein n=1 Tax=Discina gigas TaxID=1032678 RepID=A0ABR3GFE4_9PEZI